MAVTKEDTEFSEVERLMAESRLDPEFAAVEAELSAIEEGERAKNQGTHPKYVKNV